MTATCRFALAGISLLTAPSMLSAAQPRVEEVDAITVIGTAPPAIRQQVTDYVREVGIARGETPAARFIDPVCPKAIGLSPGQASLVESRIRQIAEAASAKVAPANCEANLIVVFTDQAAALVRKISQRNQLGDVDYGHRQALESGSMPIRWWYTHEYRGENGAPLQGGAAPIALQVSGMSGFGVLPSIPPGARVGFSDRRTESLIQQGSMRAIRHATVVVDVNTAAGKNLSSIIDFASLVGLAEIRPNAEPTGSILGLFSTAEFTSLSPNDRALLKGLYSLQMTRKADQHRRVLIGSILRDRLDPKATNRQ